MLQQTQASRVAEKMPRFLQLFPDVFSLGRAGNAEIIRAWQGMGYNNRALRLRDCAAIIAQQYAGEIPRGYAVLRSLPGIGDYTARALLAFAWHEDVHVVDVNIRRVYSRIFSTMPTNVDLLPESVTRDIAEEIFPRGRSSEWHQALMDLGAGICTARNARCGDCPLSDVCGSAFSMSEKRREKKVEPAHRNVPNRIWRGKTIECLRSAETVERGVLLNEILDVQASEADHAWFHTLLAGLERDRLVSIVAEKVVLGASS
jgi:A/G-specific adenine glycosylase